MSKFRFLVNGRQVYPIKAEIVREGERSVDTAKVQLLLDEAVRHGDKFEYLFDDVDIDNLVVSLPMQWSSKDESGNELDGVDVDVSYVDVDDGKGASIADGGSITVAYDDQFAVGSKDFVVAWRGKIDVDAVDIVDSSMFAISKDGNNVQFTVGDVGSGDIEVDWAGYATIVIRLVGNLAIAYFNGESIWTSEITRVIEDDDIVFGDEQIVTDFRMYIGEHTDSFITNLNRVFGKSIHTMWFSGEVWRLHDDSVMKSLEIRSYGKILGDVEARGNVYSDTTVDEVVKRIVEDNTDLSVVSGDRNLTLNRFITDGNLLDMITDLSHITNSTWSVDARKNFIFEEKEAYVTDLVYEHGVDALIFDSVEDDSELVNSLTILGEPKRVSGIETVDNLANDANYMIAQIPIVVTITTSGGAVWQEGEDYDVSVQDREITFRRDTAAENLTIRYEYEVPLRVHLERTSSIEEYGVRSKRLFRPWVDNVADLIRYGNTYLDIYSNVRQNVDAQIFGVEFRMQENAVVRLVNPLKLIDGSFLVKSIKWTYPDFMTYVNSGEYSFDEFESRKALLDKVHSLEQYLTRNKEALRIVGFELELPFGAELQESQGISNTIDIPFSVSFNQVESDVLYNYGDGEYGEAEY